MGTCYQATLKNRSPTPYIPPKYRCGDTENDELEDGFINEGFDPSQDKRKTVNMSELKAPFCQIGLLVFRRLRSTQLSYSTGFLIKQDLVITSAHPFSVRNSDERKTYSYKPILFYYQLSGEYSSGQQYHIADYRINELYHEVMLKRQGNNFPISRRLLKDLIPFDYALIKLKQTVKDFAPPKILKNYQKGDKMSCDRAVVYGYSDYHMVKDYSHEQNIIGAYLVGQQKEITNTEDNYINHNIQTSKCQSGSPIYLLSQDKDQAFLVGIHSGYFSNNSCQKYGVLVSNPFIQHLKEWAQQMSSHLTNSLDLHNFNLPPTFIKSNLEDKKLQQKAKELEKQITINKIRPQNYSELDIGLDIEGSEYYILTQWHQNRRKQKRIKRSKCPINEEKYLISSGCVQKGNWYINLYVAEYSNQPLVIGFMDKRKYELDLSECNFLYLKKDRKDQKTQQEIGALWNSNEKIKVGQEISLREKKILRIFINMDQKRIFWAFSATNVVDCPIKHSQCALFIGLNDFQSEIRVVTMKR